MVHSMDFIEHGFLRHGLKYRDLVGLPVGDTSWNFLSTYRSDRVRTNKCAIAGFGPGCTTPWLRRLGGIGSLTVIGRPVTDRSLLDSRATKGGGLVEQAKDFDNQCCRGLGLASRPSTSDFA